MLTKVSDDHVDFEKIWRIRPTDQLEKPAYGHLPIRAVNTRLLVQQCGDGGTGHLRGKVYIVNLGRDVADPVPAANKGGGRARPQNQFDLG